MSFETPEQLAAGIALAKKTAREFASEAKIGPMTLSRILNSDESLKNMRPHTRKCLEKCFALYDIEFTEENGVKKRTNQIRRLRGKDAMSDFLDDVYQMIVKTGTLEKPTQLFMYNVFQSYWTQWMGEKNWDNHHKRMSARRECIDCRTILKEGDYYFPSAAWTEYKWFPEDIFSDKTFYSYGSKLAFLQFFEDDIEITIMDNADFAEGYNNLFLIAWESVAIVPPKKK